MACRAERMAYRAERMASSEERMASSEERIVGCIVRIRCGARLMLLGDLRIRY